MSNQRTYYDLLGVSPLASDEEIKRAYRQLAKQYHPDTSVSDDATRMFQEVHQAYETLIDARARALYDSQIQVVGRSALPAPFKLNTTCSHPNLRIMDDPQMLYVLTEIKATPRYEVKRPMLNLCLVLDNSLSMDGPRLQQAREAAIYLIDHLYESDILSIVLFSDRARVVVEGPLGLDRATAKANVRAIGPDGGTELLNGISLGLEMLRKWRKPGSLDRLILLTDGQTYGDEAGCLEASDAALREKIGMTLLGLGHDWNDKLLDEMASRSSGFSAFIDSPAKLLSVFQDHFRELSDVLVPNLTLECRLSKQAQIRSMYRLTPDITRLSIDGTVTPLGSLEISRPIYVLFELVVNGPKTAGDLHIMRIKVSGELLSLENNYQETATDVSIAFSEQTNPSWKVPGELANILARIAAFKVQEKAMNEVEQGDYTRATNRLKVLATHLLNFGEVELARVALLEADDLARTGQLSEEGRKRIHYGTRSLSQTVLLSENREEG